MSLMGETISGCPENLLLRLSSDISKDTKFSIAEQPPPDLTLRLSLNGDENSLTRSSSVIGIVSQNSETWKWDDTQTHPGSFLSLARSCSLPSETDFLGRIKLKELHLMKRMELKKRSGRAASVNHDKSPLAADSGPPSPSDVVAWAAASAAKSPALCRAIDKIKSTQGSLSQSYTVEGYGSVGSTKGSSSSQSSLESNDRKPVVTTQTLPVKKLADKPPTSRTTNDPKRAKHSKGFMEGNGGGMDVMRTMPSVSTVGDGPNGRKVEGFLYKYMKGQVCIVCVCHGSFLTPAEFVKHAGGSEVANPMKHIHVCCTSFSL